MVQVQLTLFVDTTDYYPKCAFDRWIDYTLKENFTSSRLLKNENYTYLKLVPYINAVNREWWRMTGSNRRPPACKAGALPAELIPRFTADA